MIRVLIVDDSKMMALAIKQILSQDPEISVAGIASNGLQAVEMAKELKPDLITMDIQMPGMDGFEATQRIMAETPTPILVISAHAFKEGMEKVFKALSYGALEVIDKAALENGENWDVLQKELIEKVKFLSRIPVVRHSLKNIENSLEKSLYKGSPQEILSCKIIGIVSSTGGPQALRIVLRNLPLLFPCPIVVVQHISDGFVDGLVEWLHHETGRFVEVATEGAALKAGHVYVAPSQKHMRISSSEKIELSDGPPLDFQKPSGTLLLESLAEVYGPKAMGVILTGMGTDGAKGIKAIYDKKGVTLAQDEQTSVVFGMPKAAIDLNAVHKVLPLEGIASHIVKGIKSDDVLRHL